MYFRKWIALSLVLMLALGMLTGCSPTEKQFYSLTMEASNQKVYEDSGSIEISLTQLPESMFEGQQYFTKEMLQKALNQHRIDYLVKADMNQGIFQYDLTVVDTITKEKSAFASLTYKNDILYIKVDDTIAYLKKFGDPDSNQKLDQLFGDVQYISVSSQDLASMMPPGSKQDSTDNFLQKSSQQQLLMRPLFDGLVYQGYNHYQSNIISKSNNKYSLTLRGADSIKVWKPVAIYTIKNINKMGAVLKTFVNSLDPDEIASLGLPAEVKTAALPGIDMMVLTVNKNRDKYLDDIEKMATDAQKDLTKTVNDSELVTTIEKKGSLTYEMTSKIRVHITSGTPVEELDFTFSAKDTMKVKNAIQVAAPTGNIITLEVFQNRMPKRMNVMVDHGTYSFNQGFKGAGGSIKVRVENDQTYIPLRLVAESMGEDVGWDETTQQAYVDKNGQRILMTGMVVDDQTLVKIRDFESLGYKISWNESARMVNIEK